VGVIGLSTGGYGVAAAGGLAPVWLEPAISSGSPTSDSHSMGELYVDTDGVLYQCTASGTQGTWVKVLSGGDLVLVQTNAATATTSVTTTTGDGLEGTTSADGGSGVNGQDQSTTGGYGVSGTSTAGTGIYGVAAGASGLLLSSLISGVTGHSDSAQSLTPTSKHWPSSSMPISLIPTGRGPSRLSSRPCSID
jgi:hypothetical protein